MKNCRLLLGLITLFSLGCQETYDQTVNEKTKIVNLTARPLSLSVCKLPYKKLSNQICPLWPTPGTKQIDVSPDQRGSYLLTRFTATVTQGTGKDNANVLIGSQVFLTSANFNDVTLCRDDADPMQIYLVNLIESCPANTTAQLFPVDNCEEAIPLNEGEGSIY